MKSIIKIGNGNSLAKCWPRVFFYSSLANSRVIDLCAVLRVAWLDSNRLLLLLNNLNSVSTMNSTVIYYYHLFAVPDWKELYIFYWSYWKKFIEKVIVKFNRLHSELSIANGAELLMAQGYEIKVKSWITPNNSSIEFDWVNMPIENSLRLVNIWRFFDE